MQALFSPCRGFKYHIKTKLFYSSVPAIAGHLSGEIWTDYTVWWLVGKRECENLWKGRLYDLARSDHSIKYSTKLSITVFLGVNNLWIDKVVLNWFYTIPTSFKSNLRQASRQTGGLTAVNTALGFSMMFDVRGILHTHTSIEWCHEKCSNLVTLPDIIFSGKLPSNDRNPTFLAFRRRYISWWMKRIYMFTKTQ